MGQPYESTDKPIILHGSATPTLSQVDDDEEIRKAGAVFVLRRNAENASWARESFIKSDDPDDNELFGMCLALLGDELMVADKYKIHKFKRHPDNSTWYRDDPKYYCEWYNCDCGYLSDSQKTYMPVDNNTVVLRDTSESDSSRYKVRIINRNGETYDFQSPKDYDDSFASNALALDGEHVAVAASSDSSYQTTITATADNKTDNNSYYSSTYQSGAVYVYRRNSDNLSWALEAYIKDENNTANRNFGRYSIALSGNRLAVNNPNHEVNVYRFLSRYKWSLNCPSVVTVQVVLNKNGELLRSKKMNSETCTYTDSPLTITPEEIKETWSKTDSGFKRVIEVLNSGVKYTRTYQYSRN